MPIAKRANGKPIRRPAKTKERSMLAKRASHNAIMKIEMMIGRSRWEHVKKRILSHCFMDEEPALTKHMPHYGYECASFESSVAEDIAWVKSVLSHMDKYYVEEAPAHV